MTARSLADALRAAGDDELAALLAARPELLVPVPVDMSQLAYRAASSPAVARALDRLDRWRLQVLEAACLDGPVSRDQLHALLQPAPAPAVDAAVDDLLSQVLLWDDGDALNPVAGAREVAGPGPGETGPPLEMTVGSLSAARRMDLAADLGLPAPPDTDTAIDAIVDLLRDADHVRTLLEGAPGAAVELLERLAWGTPVGTVERADRAVRAEDAASPVDWLLAHGLLAALDPRTVVLPREVGLALRGGRAFATVEWEPPPLQTADDPAPVDRGHGDRTAAAQADAVVRLVEDLLEGWSAEPPPVLKAGGLGVRDLRRVATRLDVEEWQAALLVETAYAAGLLGAGGAVETEWLPTPAYDRWRTDGVADRWVALAQAWASSTRVAGLVGGRDDRDKVVAALGPDVERWVAAQVRLELLRLLASVPPGTLLPAERLDLALAWARPRQSWGLRSALVGWTLREAELLGVTGAGALSSAGRALAAAPPGPSGDESERVAAWADAVADALDPLLPQPVDHVLLQADLTAVAPGPLVPSLARALAMTADVESTGGATVYRFTPASVRRALDAGQTADDLHTLLATHSRTPVPQPLTYLVDDLARRHGRIRVGTAGAYVRCDDTAVLDELVALSGSRAADLRLRRIAPTVLTTPTSPDALLARLRELGYAPAAESADGAVITRRPDARRAPQTGARSRPVGGGVGVGPGAPAPALLEAAVRAMRAGDRASRAPRGSVVEGMAATGAVPRTAAASTLGLLRLAIEEARPVWIGYVDTHGGATERVVDPVRLGGGYLTAYDHRSERVHTFAVHRITGVASLDDAG
jgi:Helicase conserved C-terminal domain/WYL domain